MRHTITAICLGLGLAGCAPRTDAPLTIHDEVAGTDRRMPAEWEPQAAVWLQWPQPWEGAAVEGAFAAIVQTIAEYEDVHVLVHDAETRRSAERALAAVSADRLTLHDVPTGSSWMRDNGPRYVQVGGQWVLQDWGFDGWGGRWGDGAWVGRDDAVPQYVAEQLGLAMETVTMVHERGDLEVNGLDTALVNWSVVSDRNPGHGRAELTAAFEQALGVSSVIWAEGFDPLDGTRGHVDGMARFVAEDTLLVGDDGSRLMDEVAEQIAEQRPDLRVERLVSPDASVFLNFLVGNGFVLVATSGTTGEDAEAERVLSGHFPGRDIRSVDVSALWENGGGIHCVTNDQPRLD
jgi:agmatine deiminase